MKLPLPLLVCLLLLAPAFARADLVNLDTGEVFRGKVLSQDDEKVVLEHAILGVVELPAARVASIQPAPEDGDDAGSEADAPDAADEGPAEPGPASPEAAPTEPGGLVGLLRRWNVGVELGASATRGNSQTSDLRFAVGAKRENDRSRLALDAAYYGAKTDGDTTDNQFNADALHDWLTPGSPWFYFAGAGYDFDEFEDWRHRARGSAGVGYQWDPAQNLSIQPRVGGGFAYEFGGDSENLRPEALAGFSLAWTPLDTHQLTLASFVYPDLDEFGESRTVSELAWKIDLPDLQGMAFKWGLEHEYESSTEGDQTHNDLRVFATMLLEF